MEPTPIYFELDKISNEEFNFLVDQLDKRTKGVRAATGTIQLRRIKVFPTDETIRPRSIILEIEKIIADNVLSVAIDGMTCEACPRGIKTAMENSSLSKSIKVKRINLLKKEGVFTFSACTSPEEIEKIITDAGFEIYRKELNKEKNNQIQIRYIVSEHENEQQLVYPVDGLRSAREAEEVEKSIEDLPYVHSCHVSFQNKSVIVKLYAHPETNAAKIAEFRQLILEELTNAANDVGMARDNSVLQRPVTRTTSAGKNPVALRSQAGSSNIKVYAAPPLINVSRQKFTPKRYFQKALLNLVFGLPLLILAPYIPLPLTIVGQLVGVALGGITLGIMWKTGKEFYQKAWRKFVNEKSSNMDTLISLGTGSAWLYSMLLVLLPGMFPVMALQYQFLAVNMILGIINIGRGVRAVAQEETQKNVKNIEEVFVSHQPLRATRVNPKNINTFAFKQNTYHLEKVDYKDIKKDDIVVVENGENCPVDGVIVHAPKDETYVSDETATGESVAGCKTNGDAINSGATVKTPPGMKVFVRATCDGKDNKLIKQLNQAAIASDTESSISRLVDKIASYFVPSIVGLSVLTAIGWYFLGPVPQLAWMIKSAMSVLLCACPCALGLATPISTTLSMYELLKIGIHVKEPEALVSAAALDVVVFDKTGTLTYATIPTIEPGYIGKDCMLNGAPLTMEMVLELAASIEKHYDHPIAKAFTNKVQKVDTLQCANHKKHEQGVSGIVKGYQIYVGSLAHLQDHDIEVAPEFIEKEAQNDRAGMSSIYISIDKKCVAVVRLHHDIRREAVQVIKDLKKMKIDVYMLTGDKRATALRQAGELGIPVNRVICEASGRRVTSATKIGFIKDLKNSGRCVAMVGDGLIDLGAIEAADVGIDVGPSTVASTKSKISLPKALDIPKLILVARETMKNIYQNLWWTAIYNSISLIAATGLLYPIFGFVMNPILASVAMAFSSIFVVLNSSTLSSKIKYALEQNANINAQQAGLVPRLTSYAKAIGVLFKLKRSDEIVHSQPKGASHTPTPRVTTPTLAPGLQLSRVVVKQEPIVSLPPTPGVASSPNTYR